MPGDIASVSALLGTDVVETDAATLASDCLGRCVRMATASDPEVVEVTCVARTERGHELLELTVGVDLGTAEPVNDVRRREALVVLSVGDERFAPIVLPKRADFPDVPHLNPAFEWLPRSLCLYEERWQEVRLGWTPSGFVERVRRWLVDTAYGRLHDDRQPLEPAMIPDRVRHLILSHQWLRAPFAAAVNLMLFPGSDRNAVLLAASVDEGAAGVGADAANRYALMPVALRSRPHGRLRRAPTTVAELLDLDEDDAKRILAVLHRRVESAFGHQSAFAKRCFLVLSIEIRRGKGQPVETTQWLAFGVDATLGELAVALGWAIEDVEVGSDTRGAYVRPLTEQPRRGLDGIRIEHWAVHEGFSQALAAEASGHAPDERPVVLFGVGALGSQLAATFAREGFGRWTVVDSDVLLPHNLARHALGPHAVGHEKASALADELCRTLGDETAASAVVADILSDPWPEPLGSAARSSGLVIDATASLAATRRIYRGASPDAPLVTTFFNPKGADLVVLGEPAGARSGPSLAEAAYYREVCIVPELAQHLAPPDGALLYSTSCREPSAQMPQSRVARLVGRAADAVRRAASASGPSVTLWRDDERGQHRIVDLAIGDAPQAACAGWRAVLLPDVAAELEAYRAQAGPLETGGVVCGLWDMAARTISVCLALGPLADSEEAPTHFRRGCLGLRRQVERVERQSRTIVRYIGEWHSHPPRHSASLSRTDSAFLRSMAERMAIDGLPAIMLVVGDDGIRLAVRGDRTETSEDVLMRRSD